MSNLYLYECFNCKKSLSLNDVLDFANACERKEYIVFKCPHCDDCIHAILFEGQINFGILDGFPGPAFRQHAVMRTPKLKWERVRQGCYITDSGRQWLLKIVNTTKPDNEKFLCEFNDKRWVFEPEDIGNGRWRYTAHEVREG